MRQLLKARDLVIGEIVLVADGFVEIIQIDEIRATVAKNYRGTGPRRRIHYMCDDGKVYQKVIDSSVWVEIKRKAA